MNANEVTKAGMAGEGDVANSVTSDSPTSPVSNGSRPSKRANARKSKKAARASRACSSCRKQKTRCFPAPNSLACLRCQTLALDCSFVEDSDEVAVGLNNWENGSGGGSVFTSRLDNVEHNVAKILRLLEGRGDDTDSAIERRRKRRRADGRILGQFQPAHYIKSRPRRMSSSLLNTPEGIASASDVNTYDEDERDELPIAVEDRLKGAAFGRSSLSFNASPFNIFGSLCSSAYLPPQIMRLYEPQMVVHDQNIITLGIVTEQEASDLLNHFRENYNRWVSFPEDIPIEQLLDRILKRCTFLLTVCCCVSVRYYNKSLRVRAFDDLLQRLMTELTQSLVVVPQTIEFMQALCVLAIYASSLSKGEVVFDAWFYSGIALQHFITKDVLGLVMSFDGVGPATELDEITAYRVWNHLCLAHLVNCVQSGRMCILDEIRLNMCRRTLDLSSATNFDGRMIAEITLQTIVYKFITSDLTLESIEYELQDWMEEWKYLFEQPTVQFVEAGFHYGYFMVLYYWNYIQSVVLGENGKALQGQGAPILGVGNELLCYQTIASCSDDIIKVMMEHLGNVVQSLLSFDDDDYFSYLSDQILFCGSFSALMIVKIIAVLKTSNRDKILSKTLTKSSLKSVLNLAKRFSKVAVFPDDLPGNYGSALSTSLALLEVTGLES
ncbi:hypothetical protein AWJ20_2445 [Sugiyamaella lignohabitans]|uniref:Zn(2)-C6 fungal-type domain-containing protein n=1 Tax=Sugiyamaella lignohabitans TaxID=796027 RepID=A0A167F4U0_9ASCO|nr:uncharacterized protein AWJ20_2445 [Sugiyamaella lignohabitans]ANB14832.1 hypothetical protein AWJ20_2445 [Sugiyamaella lignohabitans]